MSIYRLLSDHIVNSIYMKGGTTQSTADVGGQLPIGWPPTPDVEPMDIPAVKAFYAQGPRLPTAIKILSPTTYWKQTAPGMWSLVGLGTGLAPVQGDPGL